MAEAHGDSGGGDNTLWFVVGLLAALIVLWIATGGIERGGIKKGLFINPLPPVGNGDVYGPLIPSPGTTTDNQ